MIWWLLLIVEWLVLFGAQVRNVELYVILATATLLALTSVRNQHVSDRARANVLEALHNLPAARLKTKIVKARLEDLRLQNRQFISRYRLTSRSFMCLVFTLACFAIAGPLTGPAANDVKNEEGSKRAEQVTSPLPEAQPDQASAQPDTTRSDQASAPPASGSSQSPPAVPASRREAAQAAYSIRQVVGGMFAALGAVLGLTGLALLVFEFRRGPKTLTSNNVTLETLTSEDFIPVDGKLRSAGKAKRARPSGRSRG